MERMDMTIQKATEVLYRVFWTHRSSQGEALKLVNVSGNSGKETGNPKLDYWLSALPKT